MDQYQRLVMAVEDHILEVAKLFDEVPYSDLQGIAGAKARKTIELVDRFNSATEAERVELFAGIFGPQRDHGPEARTDDGGLPELTPPVAPLHCPECQTDLRKTGVIERREEVTAWKHWNYDFDRWIISADEVEDGHAWFECRECGERIDGNVEQQLGLEI